MKFDYSNKKSRPVVKIHKEKKKKTQSRNDTINQNIIDTTDFRPPQPYPYPIHQKGPLIEEYFHEHYNGSGCSFEYIPIFWTNIYMIMVKDRRKKPPVSLQTKLDLLDKSKKYFTIVQNDRGLKENAPDNVLVFGAGGGGHIPIPLLCDDHPIQAKERDIFASFTGIIDSKANDNHGVRSKMRDVLFTSQSAGFYYTESNDDISTFEDMMNRSIFALCPRGFGKTSFRMYEAIQMGCIPVYIYDDPWLPYKHKINWEDLGVLCHVDDLPYLSDILHSYSEEKIKKMQSELKKHYSKYFTLKGVCENVIQTVKFIHEHDIPIDNNTYDQLVRTTNRLRNKDKKITFAISAYNEFSDIHPGKSITECIEWPLQDDRVDEIVISDDCSEYFDKLQNLVEKLPKVKLYRNEKNLGTFGNKKKAVSLSSNDWVILFDSDNVCGKQYVDNLYDERWENDTIYHPICGAPLFNFAEQSGECWTLEKAPMLINKYGVSLTNVGNHFFNKHTYMEVLHPYPYDRYDLLTPNYYNVSPSIRNDLYWRLASDVHDAAFVFKEWLFAGNKIKILENQEYSHLVSNDSICMILYHIKGFYEKPDLICFYLEELSRRQKFTKAIDILEYMNYNHFDKKHPDYSLYPWDFFKTIYNNIYCDDIINVTQIGCFSLFVPRVIHYLIKEKSVLNYTIHHVAQNINCGVFGYADECCPNIYCNNDFDDTSSDILIIEDKFYPPGWTKKILSFCENYKKQIIYICNNKEKTSNLYVEIMRLNRHVDTSLIKDGVNEYFMAIISCKGS